MNIWSWVEDLYTQLQDEHPRLAWLLIYIPHFVVNNEIHQVDALIPEALALSKSVNHPWLEVYFRHWNLQSKVLQRAMVRSSMSEAVDLLERSHREDTIDCPQSICVTQDFCSAHGQADGPGFAEERIQASQEALERINPAWPCWRCISAEYAGALMDAGRAQEAMDFVEEQEKAIQLARPEKYSPYSMRGSRTEAMLKLGLWEEALEYTRSAKEYCIEQGKVFETRRKVAEARLLVRLERLEEAAEILPDWDEIKDMQSEYPDWADAMTSLLLQDTFPFQPALYARLVHCVRSLYKEGVLRHAFNIALQTTDLLLAHSQYPQACELAKEVEKIVPELHKPLGADKQLAELQERLQSTPWEVELPESAELLLESMHEGISSSRTLAGQVQWPDSWELTGLAGGVWAGFGFEEKTEELFRNFLAKQPEFIPALSALSSLYLEEQRWDDLQSLFASYAGSENNDVRECVQWYLSLALEQQGELEEAVELLHSMHNEFPEMHFVLHKRAELLRTLERNEEALEALNQFVALVPEPGPADWDRLVLGTILSNWEAVNDSSTRLGMPLPQTEGPEYEPGGYCLIRVEEEDGVSDQIAIRMGPVTARIVHINHSGATQRYNDLVVFYPQPLNYPEEGEEVSEEQLWVYPMEAVLEHGHYLSFSLDGAHPNEEALQALEQLLNRFSVLHRTTHSEDYKLTDPETEESIPGFFAFLAAPQDTDLAGFEEALTRWSQEWSTPMVWLELVQALGLEEKYEKQHEMIELYEMY